MSQPAERYCPSCERSFHEGQRCPTDGTELVVLATRPDPMLGRSLSDRYTIVSRLGAGGMGTVYRGMQHSVGRDVAIKVVSPALVADPDAIKRFLREAKLASRLSHPNAVSVLDFGQTPDGLFFLVMELLSGTTLDVVLRNEGRLRLPRIARIAQQVCDGLEGAHRLAIVHRDLKPANVMLLDGSEGRDLVKVLDFGLAKSLSKDTSNMTVTVSGALLGTPAYMSPEAATGGEVDERSDLYSLGCMLYALATGRPPFQSDQMHELLSMQTSSAPLPLTGIPAPVAAVIMRLLAKDPSARYRTAAATRHALDEAAMPYISRDLETAVANTLPGRKKSMPPVVAKTAPTLAHDSVAKPALDRKAQLDVAMAATVTPVAAGLGRAAPAPEEAPAVAAAPSVAAVAAPARSRRGLALVAAAALLVIAGGVVVVLESSGGEKERSIEPPISSPSSGSSPEGPPPAGSPIPAAVVSSPDAGMVLVLDAAPITPDAPVKPDVKSVRPTGTRPRAQPQPSTLVEPAKPQPPVDAPAAEPPKDGAKTPW